MIADATTHVIRITFNVPVNVCINAEYEKLLLRFCFGLRRLRSGAALPGRKRNRVCKSCDANVAPIIKVKSPPSFFKTRNASSDNSVPNAGTLV